MRAARGAGQEELGDWERDISESIVRRVMETREGVCISDVGDDESFSGQASVQRLKILSAMCVPLSVANGDSDDREEPPQTAPFVPAPPISGSSSSGRVLGVLYVDTSSVKYAFSDAEFEEFQTLAGYTTNVLLNNRFAIAVQAMNSAVSSMDLDQVLVQIADTMLQISGAQRVHSVKWN